jgi:hypothetical protein
MVARWGRRPALGMVARRRRRPALGMVARRRRRAIRLVVVIVLVAQLLAWSLARSWALSLGVLVFSLLLAPVAVALATDRR